MKGEKICSLFVLSGFLMSCAGSNVPVRTRTPEVTFPSRVEAVKYEEITLVTTTGSSHKGKIITLDGSRIGFRPYPYWNVDIIMFQLDEIRSIKLLRKGGGAGRGFASGFGWAFIIAGTIGGAASRYDVDFHNALLGSVAVGGTAGLVGLFIAGFADAFKKKSYDFSGMSSDEKKQAVRKIMGLPAR